MPKIALLVRYPVKGMSGIPIPLAELKTGEAFALDRAYAIENGARRFDPQNPKWFSKISFLQLMQHPRLASLTLSFEEAGHLLKLSRAGKQVAKGALETKLGRQMIEQFLAAYLGADLRGPPRIVSAAGHSFSDIAEKALHIVNLESVRDLGRMAAAELDPRRFRANVYIEGLPAWEEREWRGRIISCGDAKLKAIAETGRCEAISVDPVSALRGVSLPAIIERTWGHRNLGFYAKVVADGAAAIGANINVLGPLAGEVS